jgi:hypothetical protein
MLSLKLPLLELPSLKLLLLSLM